MKVLFASSECMPFASTGGLGEVAGALPRALAGKGFEVFRVMPYYRQIREGQFPVISVGMNCSIPLGRDIKADCEVVMHHSSDDVPTYFICNDEFFDRPHLYSLPNSDYDDNFKRFIFFQKAVTALIDHLKIRVDIVHCNDWQTGFIPLMLRYGLKGEGRLSREKTFFTIHNLAYQGCFPAHQFSLTNLPSEQCFHPGCSEYYGSINSLKAALLTADWVTTVSRNYAGQVLTPEYGNGLDGVLRDISERFSGILNGIDSETWDPARDGYLAHNYSAENISGKRICTESLRKELGLQMDTDGPLCGMVTRLDVQKGLKLLEKILPYLMENGMQLVILGTGTEYYHKMCMQWQDKYPEQVRVVLNFDLKLSHQIYGGCDILLMPSLFEPCGLNQMQALRYGTIPVVHATGGLADTIVDATKEPDRGNGYTFKPADADAFRDAMARALEGYRDKSFWNELISRAMHEDHSWEQAVEPYIELYRRLLD